ncbi:MAG: hypothetical protein ABJF65_00170 [Reichenbachiella sp.]|uniref:hypothetical protein n=1 Tax=Reichenbachiella sp. TaxID=2184521 RepID=UPI0032675CB6
MTKVKYFIPGAIVLIVGLALEVFIPNSAYILCGCYVVYQITKAWFSPLSVFDAIIIKGENGTGMSHSKIKSFPKDMLGIIYDYKNSPKGGNCKYH